MNNFLPEEAILRGALTGLTAGFATRFSVIAGFAYPVNGSG